MAENLDSLSRSSEDSFDYEEEGVANGDHPLIIAIAREIRRYRNHLTVELRNPPAVDLGVFGLLEDDAEVPAQRPQAFFFEQGPFKETECVICFTEVKANTRKCCKQMICDSCASGYISQQIIDGHVHFSCPALGCDKPLPRDEIVGRISDAAILEKYHRFVINANEDPNVKTCPNCCFATTQSDKSSDKYGHVITCVECSFVWCFECQGPSHQGIKCKDNVDGLKALKNWGKAEANGQRNARNCPKCKMLIQRSGGCDHMKCSQCKTHFCYACGERQFRARFIFGDHNQKLSVLGCPKSFMDGRKKHLRRFVRGSIFSGKLAATVVGSAVVVGLLPVAAVAAVFAGPTIGFVRLHKYLKRKKMENMVRARTLERRNYRIHFPLSTNIELEPVRDYSGLQLEELMRLLAERGRVRENNVTHPGVRPRRHTPRPSVADKNETTNL